MTDHQSSERLVNLGIELARAEANIKKLESSNKALASKFTYACERIVELEHEGRASLERRITQRSDELGSIVELTKEVERLKTVNAAFSATNAELVASIAEARRELDAVADVYFERDQLRVALKEANDFTAGMTADRDKYCRLYTELAMSIGTTDRSLVGCREEHESLLATVDGLKSDVASIGKEVHTLRGELHAKDLQIARLVVDLSNKERALREWSGEATQESGLAIGDMAAVSDDEYWKSVKASADLVKDQPEWTQAGIALSANFVGGKNADGKERVITGLTTRQARHHFANGARIVNCNGHEFVRMEGSNKWLSQYEPFTATYPNPHPDVWRDGELFYHGVREANLSGSHPFTGHYEIEVDP